MKENATPLSMVDQIVGPLRVDQIVVNNLHLFCYNDREIKR